MNNHRYNHYPCPYCAMPPMHHPHNPYHNHSMYPYPCWPHHPMYPPDHGQQYIQLMDYGPEPYVVNIEKATTQNNTFRTALWTGEYLQLTVMCINPGDDIGLEVHPDGDQFIRVEEGEGLVQMGDRRDCLDFQAMVYDDYAILIPAGKWHNLINTGCKPLKVYVIYAPPEHPRGTVHPTKEDAERDHH